LEANTYHFQFKARDLSGAVNLTKKIGRAHQSAESETTPPMKLKLNKNIAKLKTKAVGLGRIFGVGNGDPSFHEPMFISRKHRSAISRWTGSAASSTAYRRFWSSRQRNQAN
jgi:hypothetical protein